MNYLTVLIIVISIFAGVFIKVMHKEHTDDMTSEEKTKLIAWMIMHENDD